MTAPAKKVTLIINPIAGTGQHPDPKELVKKINKQHSLFVDAIESKNPGDITLLASKSSGPDQIILIAGGDGSVHEAALGLKDSPSPLGILPYGSGNGLARHLGISHQPEQAVHQLLMESKVANADLIRLNEHYFLNAAGVGFDGMIAREFSKDGSRGLRTYLKLIVRNFFKFQEFKYSLSADQKTITGSAWMITLANGSEFGNGAKISPGASINDGQMDLVIIRKPALLELPWFMYKLLSGSNDQKKIIRMRIKKIQLNLKSAQEYHLDGEYDGCVKHLFGEVVPECIKLLVPKSTTNI